LSGAQHLELRAKSQALLENMRSRRSVRAFSRRRIPLEVVEDCIAIAASAPSGANMQPWTFVLVRDPEIKQAIRRRAEAVERDFYARRASREWKKRLAALDTGPQKAFLEEAPYLICIFAQRHGLDSAGRRVAHYYPLESVGIATGFLIASLHLLGISTLTYTPSPMSFLNELLDRPSRERPFMILVVGYPDAGYVAPVLDKKEADQYLTVI
jgi:nitroreductase